MKRALAALGLLLAALLPAASLAGEQAARVFERAAPSVYSVLATRGGDTAGFSQGSAVVVAPGRLVTNYHVIDGASDIRVRRGGQEQAASLERSDASHDLALLRVDGLDAATIELGGTLQVGQSVYAVGSPRGLELSLSEGIVSSLRATADGSLIQTTAPISPGSSGGGLFDAEGRLVGLTTAQAVDGQNLNFAIPVAWLTRLGLVVPPSGEAVATAAPADTPPPSLPPAATAPVLAAPPAAVAAAPRAPQTSASAADAAQRQAQARRTLFTATVVIALLLLLVKPATRWLSDALDRGLPEARERAARSAPARGPTADRLAPYRQQARAELGDGSRDPALWAQLLQQAGGQELQAGAAYIEQRAQRLYRAELDRQWTAAQAQSQGPLPPRG